MHVRKNSFGILQVSTYDLIGGAERVAWNLFQAYRERGYPSWMAVGHKLGDDPDVFVIPNREQRGSWARFWSEVGGSCDAHQAKIPGARVAAGLAQALAEPGRALDRRLGVEDFGFPGTSQLLGLTDQQPSVVHCHNLHGGPQGGFFDLRALPWLSRRLPVGLTLHHAWLLSAHCAHSFDCERWMTGCGNCPDLSIDPAVRRYAPAYN